MSDDFPFYQNTTADSGVAAIDPQRQKRAKEFAHIRQRLMLLDLGMGAVYIGLWLFTGWSRSLVSLIQLWTTNEWLLVAAYGAVFGGIYFLLSLPAAFYADYLLPHRFEISNQTIQGWISDLVKSILLSVLFGGIVLEILYWLLRAFPDGWWLLLAGVVLLFNVLLANLAPVIIFPLFFKIIPLGEEYSDLEKRLTLLAERAGTHVKGVYRFDMSRRTKAANAALIGLGNTRRIVLADTLLAEFSQDEIETVLAHELAHHVHHDIPLGIIMESIVTLAGFYLTSLGLQWGVKVFGFESVADIAALPLFAAIMGVFGLVTMPLGNAYSRWRETKADRYALQVTGKGNAYASALTRLANQNLGEVDPEPWIEFLLYSHPALGKRIEMALNARAK